MLKRIGLPYPTNALEPYYKEESLVLHYDVLYKGYVDKYNAVQEKLKKAREENQYDFIKALEKELSFQGAGAILHAKFFENMGPAIPSSPSQELMEQIQKDFGSFEQMKRQFSEAAKVVEGSGWCLLVWVDSLQKLEILQCEKHQNLTLWGCIPMLVLDMWEHSYYLQYKTQKSDYIQNWWNIVNWNVVNKRFQEK